MKKLEMRSKQPLNFALTTGVAGVAALLLGTSVESGITINIQEQGSDVVVNVVTRR